MKSVFHIALGLILSCSLLAFGEPAPSAWPDVSNEDIQFTLGFAGIMANAKPGSATDQWTKTFTAESSQVRREQETKKLLSFLHDKNRWIAAHVILTWITPGRYKISDDSWAGLKITEMKDGRFTPVEGQQEKIAMSWAEKK